jgi:hypothetical protein
MCFSRAQKTKPRSSFVQSNGVLDVYKSFQILFSLSWARPGATFTQFRLGYALLQTRPFQCRASVRIGLGQGLKEEHRFSNIAYYRLQKNTPEVNENAFSHKKIVGLS